MILTDIKLNNFRNYKNVKIKLSDKINIIYGDNGQGKTNLLESIYVLALTKSHRMYIDNNLIYNNSKQASISGTLLNDEIKTKLSVKLSQNEKILTIDSNVEKKVSNYISKLNIIFFYPEDLELQSNYMIILNDYNKLIKIKNKFLKNKNLLNDSDKQYFKILNEHIVNRAVSIYLLRKKYIDKIYGYFDIQNHLNPIYWKSQVNHTINSNAEDIYYKLTGIKKFYVKYKPSIDISNDRNEIIRNLKRKLEEKEKDEFRLKKSLIGPHLDDYEFFIDEKNLKSYGSQGQQRIAVLSIKLSEVEIFKYYKNTFPILLLDDVFSELDNKKRNLLLKYINNNIQSIITTTDLRNINKKVLLNSKIFKITNGTIIKEVEKNG